MTQPNYSVRSIVARTLAGDRDALEELLLLRYDWLRDVACRSIPAACREQVYVEEVLQDSLVRVMRDFSSFAPQAGEAGLFQWLKTIVQAAAKDAIRKHFHSHQPPTSVPLSSNAISGREENARVSEFIASLEVYDDPRASPESRSRGFPEAFYVALANLDPKYKQVIEILYFEQLTVEEAAKKLDITPAAVCGLRQRAREKIREAMVRLSHFV